MNCCIHIEGRSEEIDFGACFLKKEKKEWDNVDDNRTKNGNSFAS